MKRIIHFAVCAALIAVSFSSCVFVNFTDFNTVAGKGERESYEFKVSEFNSIRVEGFCEIRYYAAFSNTVTLEVQPNLLEYYAVEVSNGELVVRTTRRVNVSKTPVLTVSTPVLSRLTIGGACVFTAHDKITAGSFELVLGGAGRGRAELDVESLFVNMSGAGDFKLSGNADTADFNISGAGNLDALSLQTREAQISISGAGEVRISCSEKLRINADGMGTVEYSGSPSLDVRKNGLVNVKKLN
jgi:hypothetical protein